MRGVEHVLFSFLFAGENSMRVLAGKLGGKIGGGNRG